jgi:rare lipoprotein A
MRIFYCFAQSMVSFALLTVAPVSAATHGHMHANPSQSHKHALGGLKSHHFAERQQLRHRGHGSNSGSMAGMASYYGSESGAQSASGARINPSAMTAAHPSLPFGTKVRVTNQGNGRSVVVTITDRGPFVRGRIIDVSSGAAGVIGMKDAGVARVSLEVVR